MTQMAVHNSFITGVIGDPSSYKSPGNVAISILGLLPTHPRILKVTIMKHSGLPYAQYRVRCVVSLFVFDVHLDPD